MYSAITNSINIFICITISILYSCSNPSPKSNVTNLVLSDSAKCEETIWRNKDSAKCICIKNGIADTTVGRVESYIYIRGINSQISDVQIELKDASRAWETKTNDKGFFEIYGINIVDNSINRIDYFSLSCHKPGYKCLNIDSIPLVNGSVVQIEIRLKKLP